uniref:Uncharacterized protein n=1 Tax=Cacopsylla melanoneura TaxID=428564 RepID=A0A8D8YZD9_9HEMI
MSKEHEISTIVAQTAYIESQHDLKLAEIKRLEAEINEVTNKSSNINGKIQQIQEKKKVYKIKQKEALVDREGQSRSNEYLNQSVVDLENQVKALETELNKLENHCEGVIRKNKTKLLELRKHFSQVPFMMELTKIKLEENRRVKDNEKYQLEIDQLERQIDELRIDQQQKCKKQIIALSEHVKLKWNLENLPAKHREYNKQLKTLQEQDDQMGKRLPSTKEPNNISKVNDLDSFFSFAKPSVTKKTSLQSKKSARSTFLQNQKPASDSNNNMRSGNKVNQCLNRGQMNKVNNGNTNNGQTNKVNNGNSQIGKKTAPQIQRSQEGRQTARMDKTKTIQTNETKEPRNTSKNGATVQNGQQAKEVVQKSPENKSFRANQKDRNKSHYNHDRSSTTQQTPLLESTHTTGTGNRQEMDGKNNTAHKTSISRDFSQQARGRRNSQDSGQQARGVRNLQDFRQQARGVRNAQDSSQQARGGRNSQELTQKSASSKILEVQKHTTQQRKRDSQEFSQKDNQSRDVEPGRSTGTQRQLMNKKNDGQSAETLDPSPTKKQRMSQTMLHEEEDEFNQTSPNTTDQQYIENETSVEQQYTEHMENKETAQQYREHMSPQGKHVEQYEEENISQDYDNMSQTNVNEDDMHQQYNGDNMSERYDDELSLQDQNEYNEYEVSQDVPEQDQLTNGEISEYFNHDTTMEEGPRSVLSIYDERREEAAEGSDVMSLYDEENAPGSVLSLYDDGGSAFDQDLSLFSDNGEPDGAEGDNVGDGSFSFDMNNSTNNSTSDNMLFFF